MPVPERRRAEVRIYKCGTKLRSTVEAVLEPADHKDDLLREGGEPRSARCHHPDPQAGLLTMNEGGNMQVLDRGWTEQNIVDASITRRPFSSRSSGGSAAPLPSVGRASSLARTSECHGTRWPVPCRPGINGSRVRWASGTRRDTTPGLGRSPRTKSRGHEHYVLEAEVAEVLRRLAGE